MERCPSAAFAGGFGPTMKEEVVTNLHLKCCPARPPHTRVPVLANEPFGARLVHAFTKARFAFGVIAVSQTGAHRPRLETRAETCVTDFVWLNPQVSPFMSSKSEIGTANIGDFTVH